MAENQFFFFVLKISHSCQILNKETHLRESLYRQLCSDKCFDNETCLGNGVGVNFIV